MKKDNNVTYMQTHLDPVRGRILVEKGHSHVVFVPLGTKYILSLTGQ